MRPSCCVSLWVLVGFTCNIDFVSGFVGATTSAVETVVHCVGEGFSNKWPCAPSHSFDRTEATFVLSIKFISAIFS